VTTPDGYARPIRTGRGTAARPRVRAVAAHLARRACCAIPAAAPMIRRKFRARESAPPRTRAGGGNGKWSCCEHPLRSASDPRRIFVRCLVYQSPRGNLRRRLDPTWRGYWDRIFARSPTDSFLSPPRTSYSIKRFSYATLRGSVVEQKLARISARRRVAGLASGAATSATSVLVIAGNPSFVLSTR
jgi:hypothetical protein